MARKHPSSPSITAPSVSNTVPHLSDASATQGPGFDWDEGFSLSMVKSQVRPKKKRKIKRAAESAHVSANIVQPSPFEAGCLSEGRYNIHPVNVWNDLTIACDEFSIQGDRFTTTSYVFVKPDSSEDTTSIIQGWVARILEIRTSTINPEHIFLRVYWMYRPEDLPGGRQPYHGDDELIASNDMAVISSSTVESEAMVVHWQGKRDKKEEDLDDDMFWRQTLDVMADGKLSELPKYCVDNIPCHPDDLLVRCESCFSWLHGSCLEKHAVQETFKQKGYRKTKSRPKFFACISNLPSGKICLTVSDRGTGAGPSSWNVAIKCLVCGEVIQDAATEERESAESPTPVFGDWELVPDPELAPVQSTDEQKSAGNPARLSSLPGGSQQESTIEESTSEYGINEQEPPNEAIFALWGSVARMFNRPTSIFGSPR